MSDQTTNNVAEFFSPGPGERLRAARLSMGYDLAKIASELHLTTPVVEALEADEFTEIGARVFVRGYLRNYARIVGMPVDSILRQFDEKWPDDDKHPTMVRQSPTLPADGGPGRGLAGAMTWLLLIGLVVLFLVWWRGYLDEIVPEQMRAAAPAGDGVSTGVGLTATAPSLPMSDSEPADGSLRLPAPPADLPEETAAAAVDAFGDGTLTLPPPSAAGPDTPSPAVVATVTAAASQAPAGTSLAAAPADSSAIAATSATAVVPATPAVAAATDLAAPGAPVVDGTHQVVMDFSGACWVDVRDSERRFKLFGEMPQGTRKVLGGKPPYKMVIGNAKVVTITVNGEPFDLLRYAKGNVARFTLDP
ncbi:MAG: DUF4115 domain-containing protein [Gammaproteobacteria bacterium]|nr:DUF4115 domain-containing protein [Gammaproteobacteria bacterium]